MWRHHALSLLQRAAEWERIARGEEKQVLSIPAPSKPITEIIVIDHD
jgi:hypothetical protein